MLLSANAVALNYQIIYSQLVHQLNYSHKNVLAKARYHMKELKTLRIALESFFFIKQDVYSVQSMY